MDERALILTILKLLSQQDYSQAQEKMQALARLSPMAGALTMLAAQRDPSEAHRGRQNAALQAPGAAAGADGVDEGGAQDAVDPDIYTKVDGRYKYGINLRDSEEIRVVKGIMLKILLQLDEQEANLQKQQDLWNEVCPPPPSPPAPSPLRCCLNALAWNLLFCTGLWRIATRQR